MKKMITFNNQSNYIFLHPSQPKYDSNNNSNNNNNNNICNMQYVNQGLIFYMTTFIL